MNWRRTLLAATAMLALSGGIPAGAQSPSPAAGQAESQDTRTKLQGAEQRRRAAEAALVRDRAALTATQSELAQLSRAMQGAVHDLRQHEVTIAKLNDSLNDLAEQHRQKEQELDLRRKQVGSVLSALVRLTALPPEAALFGPGSSDQRLRSALLVRNLAPSLQDRAELLQQDIAAIRLAEEKIAKEEQRLTAARRDLARRYARLQDVVAQKEAVLADQSVTVDHTAAMARRFAKSAAGLRELLVRLEAEKATRRAAAGDQRRRVLAPNLPRLNQEAPPLRLAGLDGQEGGLIAPLSGQVVYRFGEGEGIFRDGITVLGVPDTPVLSPADGRIVYAGPYRDYGVLLIIEHGGGFHSVLTGLDRTDREAGEWVLAGEPLGKTAPHGSLYIEIRREGRPVDPLVWFTVGRS